MSKINKGLFTSNTGDWRTPQKLYEELNEEFGFNYDPCPFGAKEDPNFTDGLSATEWGGISFVNPPYGTEIGKWIKKGYEEYLKGKTIVFLVPSRTDTKWWHEYIMKANEIRFIKGRLKFGEAKNSAPFPSAIVIFKHKK